MQNLIDELDSINDTKFYGEVSAISGLLVECVGLSEKLSIGSRLKIHPEKAKPILTEVIGFKGKTALLMPFEALDGIGIGNKVEFLQSDLVIHPNEKWLGRIINALGEPIDGKGALPKGDKPYKIKNTPPSAGSRNRVGGKMDLGVRAMNTFTTLCKGQRMVFSPAQASENPCYFR